MEIEDMLKETSAAKPRFGRMSLFSEERDYEKNETATADDEPDITVSESPDVDVFEPKTSNTNVSYDPNHDRKDDPKWLEYVNKKLKEHADPTRRKYCTIFEVPRKIRERNVDAYEPEVVSIGPYHHDHPNLTHSSADMMTNYKSNCLYYLIARHVQSNNGHVHHSMYSKCVETMRSLENKVRSCYFDENKLPSKVGLSSVMLLDGCFILNLLLKQVNRKNDKPKESDAKKKEKDDDVEDIKEPLLGMMWVWNKVEYDLLKLENQIPFFVLDALFELLRTPEDESVNLVDLALELFNNLHPAKAVTFKPPRDRKFLHLLHLFHSSLQLDVGAFTIDLEKEKQNIQPKWIPSGMELQRGGVRFRGKKNANCFLDITFENGVMEVPRLEAYDYTETLLRNLIAFEQCYPKTEMQVTTYALFMDCIIDRAEDVNLLELKGIIVNRLSTDEAVADLFNNLCKDIHYSLDKNYLSSLFTQVTKYHNNKWHSYRARLMRDYFSNPWAIISLIAAAILLLLTVEQAYFAAYSYFKPNQK